MRERYACVLVKEFPAQSLLRLRPELRPFACVVLEGEPPVEKVCSINRKARSLGIVHGMTKVEVETFENIAVLKRSRVEELTARNILLECAGGFSPRVEDRCKEGEFLCGIDITGTEKLFGPEDVLARRLLAQMQQLAFTAQVAISSNFHSAAIAVQGLNAANPILILPAGAEKKCLAGLPLSVLGLNDEQAAIFSAWGIRSLGMLADLPEEGLIARMGQAGKQLRDLACGEQKHLFKPIVPEFALAERMEFDSPIEDLNSLLFLINTFLDQLILRAMSRALALASIHVTLQLEGGTAHHRTVKPALPNIDRALWLKLLHLDLEAHPASAAVAAITLEAEPGKSSKVQLGLFSPQLPDASRLDVTLARIRAIVGEENVGRPVLLDTHEPDAFRIEPFTVPSSRSAGAPPAPARLALRQLRPPEGISITLRSDKPHAFRFRQRDYTVQRAYGPWFSSGNWWKQTQWNSEQWDIAAHASEGSPLFCCVARDVLHNQWAVLALYD